MGKLGRRLWSPLRLYTLLWVVFSPCYWIIFGRSGEYMSNLTATARSIPFLSIVTILMISAFYFVTHIERSESEIKEIELKRRWNEAGIKENAFMVWFYIGGISAFASSVAAGFVIYHALLPKGAAEMFMFEVEHELLLRAIRFALFIFVAFSSILFLTVASGPQSNSADRDSD